MLLTRLLFAVLFFLVAHSAEAVTRYAVPTGGLSTGTCTTTGTACTTARLIDQCVAGDICLLRNGTYSATTITTVRDGSSGNPITFRAENPHKAIVVCCGSGFNWVFHKKHKFITIQDIIFDGNQSNASAIIRVSPVTGTTAGTVITDSIVEGNIIRSGGGGAILYQQVNGAIFRWNTVDSMGWKGPGEGIYTSTTTSTDTHLIAHNLTVYSNRFYRTTQNAIDFKRFTDTVIVRRNLIEDHESSAERPPFTYANDGVIRSEGSDASTGNRFDDNIIRNSPATNTGSIFRFTSQRVDADDNVIHTVVSNVFAHTSGSTSTPHQITNNTACGTDSDITSLVTPGTAVFTGSVFNQSQSVCNTEVTRILAEMLTEPGNPNLRWTGPTLVSATTVDATHTDFLFLNNNFPPLSNPDHTKFTVEEDPAGGASFVARATSAAAVQGTNIVRVTHAAYTGGAAGAMRGSALAGAVRDSANIINQNINVNSVAFTNQTVTNTLSGGGPTPPTITQTAFRFYNLRVDINGDIEAIAPLNTNRTVVPDARFLVVSQLDVTGAPAPTFAVHYRYSRNGGAYTPLLGAFDADNIMAYGNSDTSMSIPQDDTPIPACLDGALIDVPGTIQRTHNAVPNLSLNQDECIAVGVMVALRATPSGDSFDFRLYNQDGTPFVYTAEKTGRIIVGENQSIQ